MKLLLDTHIWIWALTKPELLSRLVRKQVGNAQNEIFLSPVSIWEVGHLERKGQLKIKPNITESLDRMLHKVPLREAPFNFAVASQACRIHLPHGDPGDVFLAATALVFGLTLVTQDEQFKDCTWLPTLLND